MKILVIQQKMIGDVLTTSILFEVLRQNFPDAKLHYAINQHTIPVVENNPFIDKLVIITPEIEASKLKFFKFLKTIKKEKYDVVIDPYAKISSYFITLFSKAKIRISQKKWYSTLCYNYNIESVFKKNESGKAVLSRLHLLEPLKVFSKAVKPKIYLTTKEKENSKNLLEKHGIDVNKKIFMISVLGSSAKKTYPPTYMAEILDFIAKTSKAQILFNYIPEQQEQAKKIFNLCSPITKQNINLSIFGESLRGFLGITSHCTALIGNEGGAVNMAKALNIPTFSIFSPWIRKTSWNLFEDDDFNTSIHLADFKPDLYAKDNWKAIKKNANALYKAFNFKLFKNKLEKYLDLFN